MSKSTARGHRVRVAELAGEQVAGDLQLRDRLGAAAELAERVGHALEASGAADRVVLGIQAIRVFVAVERRGGVARHELELAQAIEVLGPERARWRRSAAAWRRRVAAWMRAAARSRWPWTASSVCSPAIAAASRSSRCSSAAEDAALSRRPALSSSPRRAAMTPWRCSTSACIGPWIAACAASDSARSAASRSSPRPVRMRTWSSSPRSAATRARAASEVAAAGPRRSASVLVQREGVGHVADQDVRLGDLRRSGDTEPGDPLPERTLVVAEALGGEVEFAPPTASARRGCEGTNRGARVPMQ
jgi:hypothetical protein